MSQVRSQVRSNQVVDMMRPLKKFLLSAFVVGTFGIYALHEHLSGEAGIVKQPTVPGTDNSGVGPANPDTITNNSTGSNTGNTGTNTQQSVPASSAKGQLKDGTFTGNEADAFYGYVKVAATVQGGRITDVQFLDYPHDRRTSQEINSQAMPWLHDEAIQAQSAQVDLISGATLTSEAFIESLQSALSQAQG